MVSNYDRLIRTASRAHVPLAVLFEVTHRCNLGCEHCYLTEGPVGRPRPTREELTLDEVRPVLDQLAEAGTLFLTLTGGEVFMRRDFLEILAHARSCGFSVTIFTTGTLLTPETASALADLHPLKRLGTPDDVAGAALFLVSEDAGWITGVVFDVTGGGLVV